MIQFKLLPQSQVLVVSLEKSEDYVLPTDLISECRLIQNKITEVKVSQIVFVGLDFFWHKNLRIESFNSMYDCMSWAKEWRGFLKFIKELSVPTYSYIQGGCEGIGLELALACRFRIGFRQASFSCQDVRHGHLPVGGMLFRLISLVGLDESLKFLLLGRSLSSDEAKGIGLLHVLTPWRFDLRDFPLPVIHHTKFNIHFFVENLPWGRGILFRRWRREILLRFRGHFRSPLKLLDVIERGWFKGGETRAHLEMEAFSQLVFSSQANILEHGHSRLRSFFKVDSKKNLRILIREPHFRTADLISLLAEKHDVCVYAPHMALIENMSHLSGKTKRAIEFSLIPPLENNFDLIFSKCHEQGEVYKCFLKGNHEPFVLRFFSPVIERKIIEIYTEASTAQDIVSLFSSLGKFPILVKGNSSILHSPVIRMALALHHESMLLIQSGHTKENIQALWNDMGMRPPLFDLWAESSEDHFDTYLKEFSKIYPERFSFSVSPSCHSFSKDLFVSRLLKEALLLLEEKIIKDPYLVDLLMVYGLGYPRYQGGLLYQVDSEGPARWYKKMLEMSKNEGERFAPPELLRRIVEAKGRIYDRTVL